ncbi:MAG: 50S ribosomal protein L35 [Candidatus Omnitrophica bacterium]|nr:50S ribosomal protein L35 [Candidatus Omnitrophota bacterium]
MGIGKKGKLKTNKSAAKRLRMTKSGLLKKRNAGRQHILSKKSRKHKRQLRKAGYLSTTDAKRIRRLLPYGTH